MVTHTADERFTPVKRGVATLDIWVMAAFAAVTIWVLTAVQFSSCFNLPIPLVKGLPAAVLAEGSALQRKSQLSVKSAMCSSCQELRQGCSLPQHPSNFAC
ncbi:hypothetical protein WJX77_011165 [Trebouxia sp. C0004]